MQVPDLLQPLLSEKGLAPSCSPLWGGSGTEEEEEEKEEGEEEEGDGEQGGCQ